MCRNVTRDLQIEGWSATLEVLSLFRPRRLGVRLAGFFRARYLPEFIARLNAAYMDSSTVGREELRVGLPDDG